MREANTVSTESRHRGRTEISGVRVFQIGEEPIQCAFLLVGQSHWENLLERLAERLIAKIVSLLVCIVEERVELFLHAFVDLQKLMKAKRRSIQTENG